MTYEVLIPEKIERKIKKLNKVNQDRVISKLNDLEENPELGKPLRHTRLWSLRVGKYTGKKGMVVSHSNNKR